MRFFKNFFSRIPSFSSSGKHSLGCLNAAQSLGVINDNLFKFTMAYLLIDTLGKNQTSSILSATGAIYVIPFLLFSSSAGILADRFSKQKLLVLMKLAEMIIMTLAVFAFSEKSLAGCYSLLFVLSMHSALFGPSKYGIIPELVSKEAVSKANGLITSFTYLSIIIGTFLASFLTEITNRSFVLIACICLVIAVGGFFGSIAIKPTKPQGSHTKINFLFVKEIYHTLRYTYTVHHLLPSILGAAFFLLLGAFTQLNIIPFAMESLKLSEVAGGYLFLATAFGIAAGSFLAGKASRKKVELGLPCLSGLCISLLFCLLSLFSSQLVPVVILLFLVGFCGGLFIVPFDTFMQLNSDQEKRGQTIAASNFLSFLGVLIASFLLFLLNQVFGFSSAGSFAVMGGVTFFVTFLLTCTLSDLFFSYLSRKILCPLTRFSPPDISEIEHIKNPLFVLEHATWKHALQLTASFPYVHYLLPRKSRLAYGFLRFFRSIHLLPAESSAEDLFITASLLAKEGTPTCLLLDSSLPPESHGFTQRGFFNMFSSHSPQVILLTFKKDPQTGRNGFAFEKK